MSTSGHEWTLSGGEKCALCGDKDWMADKFCEGNPKVAAAREQWLSDIKKENQNSTSQADNATGE